MSSRPSAADTPATAEGLLARGREHEQRGRLAEAAMDFAAAIDSADPIVDARVLAESLRRLAALRRRRNELEEAVRLCRRSLEVAGALGDDQLVAEARNGLALAHFVRGEWEEARRHLARALEMPGVTAAFRGGIEQNLGVMSNAEGNLEEALLHYERSLEAFRAAKETRSCAIAYHNLGMIAADREMWAEADDSFRKSLAIAEETGDNALRGHVLLNRAEVHIARQNYEEARRSAEQALQISDEMGARDLKADAYKFLGVVYREMGKPLLSEARLKTALDIAADAGATLAQAEATRELAVLYQGMARNQDTLKLLTTSHRLFTRLNARRDLVDVSSKTAQLESIYLEIVREWGASIESSDTYTYGHSERVASYAVQVAEAMGLEGIDLMTIRVGAYLHDLGKVRVPHEILNKPGKLTKEEFDIMRQHPVFGIEMLAAIDFPWDIRPIIRSHHEKLDGSGYPDKLRGDEVALHAQVIGVADVFDALTTTRSYRGAMSVEQAIAVMNESPMHYRRDVAEAFMSTLGRPVRFRVPQAA